MTSPTTSDALNLLLARLHPAAMAEPPRLPEIREDPALTEAQAAQEQYLVDVRQARANTLEHDVFRAARVVKLYNGLIEKLTGLWEDLASRRRARLEWLQSQLPLGPNIAPGTSPADREVLLAAWHTALDKARATDTDGRARMLADSERFGDETIRRAVFTASYDASEWQLLDGWMANSAPDTRALMEEWRGLNALIGGFSGDVWENFLRIQFQAPRKPQEVYDLPRLVDAYNISTRQQNLYLGAGQTAQAVLDVNQLLA